MNKPKRKKVTIQSLLNKKANGEMVTSIGVYDSPMAAIADEVGFDLLINGNAGPMSLLGHPDPTKVTFQEQLILTQAVSRVARHGIVVGHMPFMSYTVSREQAVSNAARMACEGGADAVKCEGHRRTVEYVAEIVHAGVPAMGHIGMQAQRKVEQSGYGFKGRKAEDAASIVDDARAFHEAGAFALIIEYVPVEITTFLVQTLPIPVISVGGGPSADGIYLISGDAVGYSAFPRPKNEASFVDVRPIIADGLSQYKDAVLSSKYPDESFTLHMTEDEHKRFLDLVS